MASDLIDGPGCPPDVREAIAAATASAIREVVQPVVRALLDPSIESEVAVRQARQALMEWVSSPRCDDA